MCGIAGTLYNKKFLQGIEVSSEDLINLIKDVKKNKASTEEFLKLSWKYKSNINFLRFFSDDIERLKIRKICSYISELNKKNKSELPRIDKNNSMEVYKSKLKDWENLEDSLWFLSKELDKTKSTIEFLAEKNLKGISQEKIILYREISKIIHAIDNRLELRGRDSFGLSISLTSKKFNIDKKDLLKNSSQNQEILFSKKNNNETVSFVFKVSNKIGGLGDNASELKKLIKENIYFSKILKEVDIENAIIVAHTRWASVGDVNLHNTHPISLENNKNVNFHSISSLNGDIYNYKEIIENCEKNNSFSKSKKECTSDCFAISAYLVKEKNNNIKTVKKMANLFSGSFAITSQLSSSPEKLLLIKKGIQGLYLGFSYDGIIFASDVYGLVETCKFFVPIESDAIIELSCSDIKSAINPNISQTNIHTGKEIFLKHEDLKITNITTRDIDKGHYKHFLQKEIFETKDIVERTLNSYLQPELLSIKSPLKSAINITSGQIPEFIIKKLKKGELKNIVITGMGTCYTAAVAISMFMRASLKEIIPELVVEPHVASEGSAFYLKQNMNDTLVIVIAQSGTTVDTNVYVQMAKARGACSLAIANKREGDVTFIVDGTLYIGEGRDIEVAVPSTKTYTAQVILGYLVTFYLVSKLNYTVDQEKSFLKKLKNLRDTPLLIEKSFVQINSFNEFKEITENALKNNSWYVMSDDSSNSVCADEIRIKYSENCYQSVSTISFDEFESIDVKNSYLVLITEKKLINLKSKIQKILKGGNTLVIISTGKNTLKDSKKLMKKSNSLFILNMPYSGKYFSFIPTIIAGQLLSYFQAINLDKRSKHFQELLNSIDSEESFEKSIKSLKRYLKKGYFNQGFSVKDLDDLFYFSKKYLKSKNVHKTKIKLKNKIINLYEISRRTIDTIKHQAKTITVGTVRGSKFSENSLLINSLVASKEKDILSLESIIFQIDKSFNAFKNVKNIENKTILIFHLGLDESLSYQLVNFLNDYFKRIGRKNIARLGRAYDFSQNTDKNFWIILNGGSNKRFFRKISKTNKIFFDYNDWNFKEKFKPINEILKNTSRDFYLSLWVLFLGIHILRTFTDKKYKLKELDLEFLTKIKSLFSSIIFINKSSLVENQILHASKIFLTRKNWKAIGSGVNYNFAKYSAKKIIQKLNRVCSFDVLENHKHIDMSAEAAILVYIAGITKHGYQEDAMSEIKKMLAHNSLPIIFTNIGDLRFDTFSIEIEDVQKNVIENISIPVIKTPKVDIIYSYPIYVLLTSKFIESVKTFKNSESDLVNKVALLEADSKYLHENFWK
tara:strand:+ start:5129 stop:9034 length:3906 start_codon:yes stop_codon:yes gene_type:complete